MSYNHSTPAVSYAEIVHELPNMLVLRVWNFKAQLPTFLAVCNDGEAYHTTSLKALKRLLNF